MRRGSGAFWALAAWLLASGAAGQTPEVNLAARRDSALIQQVLKRPIPASLRETYQWAYLLQSSGHGRDSDLLNLFVQRSVLSQLTGEALDTPATVEAAIEGEASPAERLDVAAWRALGKVVIEYPPARTPAPQGLPPGFEQAAPGVWVQGETDLRAALSIRNGLKAPVTEVTLYYGQTRASMSDSLIYLDCTPDGAEAFEPGKRQLALCKGAGERRFFEAAIKALAGRTIAAPLLAFSVTTPQAKLSAGSVIPNESANVASAMARAQLSNASCADKGTCTEIADARSEERRNKPPSPTLFAALLLAGFALAGVAAARVKPREVEGWFVPLVASAVIVASALASIGLLAVLQPNSGPAGFVYVVVLNYAVIPYSVAVLIVCASLLGGKATRLSAFAATFGIVVLGLIVATLYT